MSSRLCGPPTMTISAENPRYSAPVVVLHGLWESCAAWRPFMGYLAHRGWETHAVDWRRGTTDPPCDRLDSLRSELMQWFHGMREAPVLIGADLGGLLALESKALARAIVALNPLVVLPWRSRAAPIRGAGSFLERLRGQPLGPPPGYRSAIREVVREAPQLIADINAHRSVPSTSGSAAPTLVLASVTSAGPANDATVPMARDFGAEHLAVPGAAFALHCAPGWQDHASVVHRWLIRALGEPLLLLFDEAERDRDEP